MATTRTRRKIEPSTKCVCLLQSRPKVDPHKKSRSSLLLGTANSDLCRAAPLSALVTVVNDHARNYLTKLPPRSIADQARSARQPNNIEGAWRTLKSRSIRNGNCVPGAARFLRLVEHATEDTRARLGECHGLAEPGAWAAQLSGGGALQISRSRTHRRCSCRAAVHCET